MNMERMRALRAEVATNLDHPFCMGDYENCFMGFAQLIRAESILDLNKAESNELFYASSLINTNCDLSTFTREEALAVLDLVIERGTVGTAWRDVIGDGKGGV